MKPSPPFEICVALCFCAFSHAASATDVLHVTLSGSLNADAMKVSTALSQIPGATVQTIVLTSSTTFPSDLSSFEQVWVTDFSTGADTGGSYTTAYQRITQWYTEKNTPDAIFDGRLLADLQGALNTALITNYYTNLDERSFGLVIGTDHNAFSTNGANTLAMSLGFNPVIGTFSVMDADVDFTHPLMIHPQIAWYLEGARRVVEANTSPGQVPYGLQPNGETLHGIAWANGNVSTPLISTTVPEPGASGMFAAASLGLACGVRRRERHR
jgi:MYXO-CTERM domain-containing protein